MGTYFVNILENDLTCHKIIILVIQALAVSMLSFELWPQGFDRVSWNDDIIIWSADGTRGFGKNDRFRRY